MDCSSARVLERPEVAHARAVGALPPAAARTAAGHDQRVVEARAVAAIVPEDLVLGVHLDDPAAQPHVHLVRLVEPSGCTARSFELHRARPHLLREAACGGTAGGSHAKTGDRAVGITGADAFDGGGGREASTHDHVAIVHAFLSGCVAPGARARSPVRSLGIPPAGRDGPVVPPGGPLQGTTKEPARASGEPISPGRAAAAKPHFQCRAATRTEDRGRAHPAADGDQPDDAHGA